MSLWAHAWVYSPIFILLHLYQVFARCYYAFDSRQVRSGNFTSPRFPSNYPGGLTCHYIFTGDDFEGLKITFLTFDLEEPYKAGCLTDYMDISTMNVKKEKHLVGRFCGPQIPSPILTMQPQAEIVFRTNYAIQRKGFYATFEFLNERDAPVPTSFPIRADCGGVLKGVGGVLTSPGYPNSVLDNLDCIWLLRVESPRHIHVQVSELQFQGSLANCDRMNLTFYDGYTSFSYSARKMKALCGDLKYYRNVEDRFILSPRNRLIIRFQVKEGIRPSPISRPAVGFRLIWTEVDFADQNKCSRFACKRSHFCVRSTASGPCTQPKQYCIDSSLVCDGIQNCSDDDSSDEDDCYIPLMIGIGATVPAVFIAILIVAIVVKRQIRVKKSSSQTQNLTMQLRQLEHSPSSSSRKIATSYSQPCDLLTPTMPEIMNGMAGMTSSQFDAYNTCSSFKGLPTTV